MCQLRETVNTNHFWNSLVVPAELAELAEPAEVVSASADQTLPSTRAGGQDDRSLTNSLKSELVHPIVFVMFLSSSYMATRKDTPIQIHLEEPWILDQGPWTLDPGPRVPASRGHQIIRKLDPGSRIKDLGSWIQDLGSWI